MKSRASTPVTLKIVFWNTRSFIQRREEVESILQNVDIFICVESWLTPKNTVRFRGFLTFRKDRRNTRGGGILILLRKNLSYSELKELKIPDDSVELYGISVNNVSPPIDLYICYRAPGLTLTQQQWQEIVNNVDDNKHGLFVGDFNAHHKVWNCRYTDLNGERFYNAIDKQNLFLHNSDTKTYINMHRNIQSNLDLLLSTPNLSASIAVEVSDKTWGSDHFPVFVKVNTRKYKYEKKTFKLKSTRTNWLKFQNELEINYSNFLYTDYDQLDSSGKYNFFIGIVKRAVKCSTPKKNDANYNDKHKNPSPWWDSECDKLKKNT